MAGFRKAKAEQAAIKMGLYGPPGTGKTLTSLMFAEGLAKITGKRIAYVDTERGTDFYSQAVPDRRVHPAAFDFDALYSRSLTEIVSSIKALDPNTHSVVVIDSITHVWEAAKNAYAGKLTGAGTIPFNQWGAIKKPYRELIAFLLDSPFHVFFCGRQGLDMEENEDGELKRVGYKMKAEGETAYEPHILLRMELIKQTNKESIISTFVEKDRTGVLTGKIIVEPTFDKVIKPILPLLGTTQAKMQTEDEAATVDAERLAQQDTEREERSREYLEKFSARIQLAENADDLKAIGKTITTEIKKQMTTADTATLREKYLEAEKKHGKGGK